MKLKVLLLVCIVCVAFVVLGLPIVMTRVFSTLYAGLPIDYVVVAEFREVPPMDDELEQWILKQPGVYIGFVNRERNRVFLRWGHTGTLWTDPITPNVRNEFEKFGYKGLISYKENKDYRDR